MTRLVFVVIALALCGCVRSREEARVAFADDARLTTPSGHYAVRLGYLQSGSHRRNDGYLQMDALAPETRTTLFLFSGRPQIYIYADDASTVLTTVANCCEYQRDDEPAIPLNVDWEAIASKSADRQILSGRFELPDPLTGTFVTSFDEVSGRAVEVFDEVAGDTLRFSFRFLVNDEECVLDAVFELDTKRTVQLDLPTGGLP